MRTDASRTHSRGVGLSCYDVGGALFLFLVPFLDRRAARGEKSPWFTLIGVAIIVFMLTMVTLAYVKPY